MLDKGLLSNLKLAAFRCGLCIKRSSGNPNDSQFSTIAEWLHTLDKGTKTASGVRKEVVEWLKQNKSAVLSEGGILSDLFSHETKDEKWNEYCGYMEKTGVSGDIITLVGAAYCTT